eukprot:gene8659-6266_t
MLPRENVSQYVVGCTVVLVARWMAEYSRGVFSYAWEDRRCCKCKCKRKCDFKLRRRTLFRESSTVA